MTEDGGIKERIEKHAKAIVTMNIPQITNDLMPEPMKKLQEQAGGGMAMQIDTYEILGFEKDGGDYVYDVRYIGKESFTVRARWSDMGDDWRIVDAELIARE